MIERLKTRRTQYRILIAVWGVCGSIGLVDVTVVGNHHLPALLLLPWCVVWCAYNGWQARKVSRILNSPLLYLLAIQDEFGIPAPLPEPICPIQNMQSYDHIDNGLLDSQQEEES